MLKGLEHTLYKSRLSKIGIHENTDYKRYSKQLLTEKYESNNQSASVSIIEQLLIEIQKKRRLDQADPPLIKLKKIKSAREHS